MIFGSCASVCNYDIVSETVVKLSQVNCDIPKKFVHRTLDDTASVSPKDKDWCKKFTETLRNNCTEINLDLAPNCEKFDKAFSCSTYGKVLGIFFDSTKLAWKIPEPKTEQLLFDINFALVNRMSLGQMQSLMGKLCNISLMCPFMKNFQQNLYDDMRKFIDDETKSFNLNEQAKKDLNIWAGFLSDSEKWIPICPRPNALPLCTKVLTSDAAGNNNYHLSGGKIGFGCIGIDETGSVILGFQHWWKESSITYEKDEKGCRFG